MLDAEELDGGGSRPAGGDQPALTGAFSSIDGIAILGAKGGDMGEVEDEVVGAMLGGVAFIARGVTVDLVEMHLMVVDAVVVVVAFGGGGGILFSTSTTL